MYPVTSQTQTGFFKSNSVLVFTSSSALSVLWVSHTHLVSFGFISFSLFFPFLPCAPSMLLTCSCCSELFVKVSAVKATLVGPLSWSQWLSDSPLSEPRGGCRYHHCLWHRHKGRVLSTVWARAWGWHHHLMHSTSVCLPCPPLMHINTHCNTTPGSSSAEFWKTVTDPCSQLTQTRPVQLNPQSQFLWGSHTILCTSTLDGCNWTPKLDSPRQHVLSQRC